MGTTTVGAFAEEVVVPASSVFRCADPASRMRRPPRSGWRTGPRTTCCGRSLACSPGERLVVLGAGGGVGLAAVQLGALLGASVTAVASSDAKLAVATAYGAVAVINHRRG